ncbi:MAG: RNA recognition motif domain-containing protein, partial [Candidatus Eiseniibacteriota bacterium]
LAQATATQPEIAPPGQENVMGKKLYVGNLPSSTSAADLESLFAAAGTVESATVINDRETGQSRGFAFVEMSSSIEASTAIEELNGRDIGGRQIMVSEANDRSPRPGGSNGARRY